MASMKKKHAVLVEKLNKHAHDDEARAYVDKTVSNWLTSMSNKSGGKLIPTDIQNLDRKVEAGCKAIKARQAEQAAGPSHHDVVLPQERNEKKIADDYNDEEVPLSYLVYATASNLQFLEEEKQRRRNIAAKKRELKEQLDAQRAENAGKNDMSKRIEAEYAETVKKNYAEFIEQKEAEQVVLKSKVNKLWEDREFQLTELNRKRAKEQARNIAEERTMLDAAAAACKAEKEHRKEKVREQKAFMERVMAENEENKRLVAAHKREMQLEDQALQEANSRRLEKQEQQRKETFEHMKAKSEGNQQKFLEATAESAAKERDDELRAIKYQQEKIARDQAALKQEAIDRELDKERLRKDLAQQVADKKRREHEEYVARSEFAGDYQAEAVKAIEEARLEAKARRERAVKNRIELQQQIAEKQARVDETSNSVMTDEEKKLNRAAIKELVKSDKEVMKIIKFKLGQAEKVDDMKKRRALGTRGGPADIANDDEYF